ncbi:hypothetical protein R3P38DRAFT_2756388 [Favolaschia claudopus]|uniref:Uncharacterized protein n=1 Tax=Favolaschia claudopus TaxID=2862362 RepID=A0AAW0EF26_9AGAR
MQGSSPRVSLPALGSRVEAMPDLRAVITGDEAAREKKVVGVSARWSNTRRKPQSQGTLPVGEARDDRKSEDKDMRGVESSIEDMYMRQRHKAESSSRQSTAREFPVRSLPDIQEKMSMTAPDPSECDSSAKERRRSDGDRFGSGAWDGLGNRPRSSVCRQPRSTDTGRLSKREEEHFTRRDKGRRDRRKSRNKGGTKAERSGCDVEVSIAKPLTLGFQKNRAARLERHRPSTRKKRKVLANEHRGYLPLDDMSQATMLEGLDEATGDSAARETVKGCRLRSTRAGTVVWTLDSDVTAGRGGCGSGGRRPTDNARQMRVYPGVVFAAMRRRGGGEARRRRSGCDEGKNDADDGLRRHQNLIWRVRGESLSIVIVGSSVGEASATYDKSSVTVRVTPPRFPHLPATTNGRTLIIRRHDVRGVARRQEGR